MKRVSILDHGAFGNGRDDDTAGYVAAVMHATKHGGCVYFPPGDYVLRWSDWAAAARSRRGRAGARGNDSRGEATSAP